ncbi:cobaltochelatase subunit CobN [Aquabacter spiritensis]|uniref:Cobaltochelatase CobN subunit n=1 Tax=Aquabacter spiritensis TaxID=933073 RepID=A0A4R3M8W8_9HYPH|nr:cobaltochelatase subunit CobN [Aquabacter spiritensis]TCT08117.1 cobaltochelatase CobN subunit [Aquabacter spiritensis]
MHLLTSTSATIADLAEPIDLRQPPADLVVLSFTDSDLLALAAAWRADAAERPALRLARLKDLRHPMSVDLWLDRTGRHAKVIVVRLLGGLDWWRYGAERLAALARAEDIALALLPGEDQDDSRLAALSTLSRGDWDLWLAHFRQGGPDNMRHLLGRMSARARGESIAPANPRPVPAAAFYRRAPRMGGRPRALVLFYRSMWLAGDAAPIDALCTALTARGLDASAVFVSSLKDPAARAFTGSALAETEPDVVITATAFAAGDADLFPPDGPVVLQAIPATTARAAWMESPRGLAAADLAMHVVLPELDGRVLAGALSFKDTAAPDAALAFAAARNAPEPDAVALVADRAAAWARLARRPRAARRLALILPDYPASAGRTGYAVGLDVPESARRLLGLLAAEGYDVPPAPAQARDLLGALRPQPALGLADYAAGLAALPPSVAAQIEAAWGAPVEDPDVIDGVFRFRLARFGAVVVALAPERGLSLDRRADYHDPALPPRHALLAFGLWLQRETDAAIHLGAHGTLEWLPGKAAALTPGCFPRAVLGALPVLYPFIVSNPGEAAQAKRRIAAVTIGHLPPPIQALDLTEAERRLERLVDEYAAADGLDARRRDRLARLIVATATDTGLADAAGIAPDADPDTALKQIDAWLCDLKDLNVKDGHHVFGAASEDPERAASGKAERAGLLAALDGRHVAPGPAGAPDRGRRDVLPTGRNLFTADPRNLPTPTAMDLGRLAADEVVRAHLQEHGDHPRAVIVDLWGSATLRTGGEEIAQGLHLMGCRPAWDGATGRVTGIEVLPPAAIGRPRVDVTFRISGLFRDVFPTQLALLDAAARAVAARTDEADGDNPLATEVRAGGDGARIFGSPPGSYGAGIEDRLSTGRFIDRAELGRAYLAAAGYAYGGAEGDGRPSGDGFARRVAGADALVHVADDPGRDLLEGGEDAAFIGGFAAAAALLGRPADLIVLDTSDPHRPRARPLKDALARLVRGRVSPAFIAGQMRHGPRGAAELAETVDRLIAFAETTGQVPGTLIDRLHAAYLADAAVCDFLMRENPAAARALAARFEDARRRGLWHPRRNDVDGTLAALRQVAAE